jgi:S-adenosylmethionine hydrolase
LRKPVVGLLSDFGLKDSYVAEVKAVILRICPNVQIVDISHEVAKFDVRMGAFLLASAVPYFPKGTVHVAVVDPGVGTKRRPIIVETKRGFLVGPDNGVLMLAAEREGVKNVFMIDNPRFMLPRVSKTFHGRDVFAPVAAFLAKGRLPSEMGPRITNYAVPDFSKPLIRGSVLTGMVLHVDDFGNIITNISSNELERIKAKTGDDLLVKLGKMSHMVKCCSAYGEVGANELLALVGGHGFLEISVNQGDAAKRLNVTAGMHIRIERAKNDYRSL